LLTWFEFRDVAPGRPGAGMIHLIQLGVASEQSLEFWATRLRSRGLSAEAENEALRFHDHDGLAFELLIADSEGPVERPVHPEIPLEHTILRVVGARAYAAPDRSQPLLTEVLGFAREGGGYRVQGQRGHFHWAYDPPPAAPGLQGAGTVHHIAWACEDADQVGWRARVADAGAHVTPVIDRDYFLSIYFREPSHVLFEIATLSPGFAVDEDPAHLGESLRLPKQHEHLRDRLDQLLTPIVNPRVTRQPATPA
jgi:glyoxalase family protein